MADLSGGRLSPARLDDFEDESLDPRIQVELERLNKASEEINKLELELDDARASFRQALSESTQKLNQLAKKLGGSVEKARPYYDARFKIKGAHVESQKAALRFERACSMHEAAKEMVQLAEQGYMRRDEPSDPAWQEMLNHATMKVNEAEKERNESGDEHMKMMQSFLEADRKVQYLQKDLKRNINKSKPYFEMKAKFNQTMEDQKRNIQILEEDVKSAKSMYSEALHSLEVISDSIHQQRVEKRKQMQLGIREAGVGSESPSPPPMRGQGHSIEGQGSVHTSSCQSYSTSPPKLIRKYSDPLRRDEFSLPSVIHSDVTKARTPSYRTAVTRQDSVVDEATLEDDVLSTSSHRDSFVKRHSFTRESSIPEFSDKRLSFTRESSVPLSSDRRQSFTREGSIPPLSTSGKPKKLSGGLILRIDAQMDPLTQQYQAHDMHPTREEQYPVLEETNATMDIDEQDLTAASKPTPHGTSTPKNLKFSKQNPFGLPYVKPSTSEPQRSTTHITSPTLSVPTPSDIDDMSDNDSIISAGPMLDDDQLKFLTLDFSTANVDSDAQEDHTWGSATLPARLSHLEQYLHLTKISTSSEDDDAVHINRDEDEEEDEDTVKEESPLHSHNDILTNEDNNLDKKGNILHTGVDQQSDEMVESNTDFNPPEEVKLESDVSSPHVEVKVESDVISPPVEVNVESDVSSPPVEVKVECDVSSPPVEVKVESDVSSPPVEDDSDVNSPAVEVEIENDVSSPSVEVTVE